MTMLSPRIDCKLKHKLSHAKNTMLQDRQNQFNRADSTKPTGQANTKPGKAQAQKKFNNKQFFPTKHSQEPSNSES